MFLLTFPAAPYIVDTVPAGPSLPPWAVYREVKIMENKKTFGMYILQRRRDLGMTQHELAERLYVTDSAVSKWERGLSYPDITLLRNICEVLGVTEHELLTGSEDTSARNSERLARKYLRLTKTYRVVQYLLYGLALATCAAVNLAVQHTLSWFFIVLASLMLCASLTLAPAITDLFTKLEHYRGAITFGCFTASLELLLLVCCIYTRGDWFAVAAVSVLFGLTVVFGPFVLHGVPPVKWLSGRRTSVYLMAETALLILLLLICCVYTGGSWFVVAAVSVLFALGFAVVPVLLRQFPLPEPFCRHKLLLYFAIQTVGLLLTTFVASPHTFLSEGLPVALLNLALPWGVMAAARYLPVNGCFRASVACAWTGLWYWTFPWTLRVALSNEFGRQDEYRVWEGLDLTVWGGGHTAQNVYAIVLLSLALAALILAACGAMLCRRRKNEKI